MRLEAFAPSPTSTSLMHFAELFSEVGAMQGVSLGVLISLVTAAWPASPLWSCFLHEAGKGRWFRHNLHWQQEYYFCIIKHSG